LLGDPFVGVPIAIAGQSEVVPFISDFTTANKKDSNEDAVKAWKELKAMDAPKTYETLAKLSRSRRG
jgi:hypothetical protein